MRLQGLLVLVAIACLLAAAHAVGLDKVGSQRHHRLANNALRHAAAQKDKVMTRAATVPTPHKAHDETVEATLVPRKGEKTVDKNTVMNDNRFLAAELIDDYPQRFSKFTTLLEMHNIPATFRSTPKLLEMSNGLRHREFARGYNHGFNHGVLSGYNRMRFAQAHDEPPAETPQPPAENAPDAPAGNAPYVSQGFYAPPAAPPPMPVDLPPPPYIPPLIEGAESTMPRIEESAVNAAVEDASVLTEENSGATDAGEDMD